jgi:hypothetical protein
VGVHVDQPGQKEEIRRDGAGAVHRLDPDSPVDDERSAHDCLRRHGATDVPDSHLSRVATGTAADLGT